MSTEGPGTTPVDVAEPTPDPPMRKKASFLTTVVDTIRELVIVVVMALALSFVVKSWLIQAFYIPSESMQNTLIRNDRVIVNKLTPDLMDLHRGDVVVFSDPGGWADKYPPRDRGPFLNAVRTSLIFVGLLPDPADDHLIKRLIGMPGDHVVCCTSSGQLTVNGQAISETYLKPGVAPSEQKFDIHVPAGKIWVMGDNRSNSADSRFHDSAADGTEGSVSLDLVTGRAILLVWPFDRFTWLTNHAEVFATVPAATTTPSTTGATSANPSSS